MQTLNQRHALQLVAPRTLGEAGIEGPLESDEEEGPGFWRGLGIGVLISAAFYLFIAVAFTAHLWGPWVDR